MNQAEKRLREKEEKEALNRKQDEVELPFRGNRFFLKINHPRERRFYRLVDMEVKEERLELPGSFGGLPIREADLLKGVYPQVKTLILPGELDNLQLKNDTFPSLLKVTTAAKGPYSTDGRMIYRENGTRLVYALRQAYEKRMVIPGQVKRIGRSALVGATFEELVVENERILVEEGAFDGSLWEERQKVVYVGSLLYRVRAPIESLRLPSGVNRFKEGCFSRYAPKRLILSFFPRVSDVFHWGEVSGDIKELEITDENGQAHFSVRDLMEWKGLEAVILPPSHQAYLTREGVLFSKDGKKLLFYPRQKRQEVYQIPEEVEEVGREAFAGNPYLTSLSMGGGVKGLGEKAFALCTSLRECSLSDGLRVLPGAGPGSIFEGGLFAGCEALTRLHLPKNLEELGAYALQRTGVRSLTLPPSLKRVRLGALWDVVNVYCSPGTAKGLMAGLLPYGKARNEAARVYYEGREEGGYLFIPHVLGEKGVFALEEAWNGEGVSFHAYERAFEQAEEGLEKAHMALVLILWGGKKEEEEKMGFVSYLRGHALALGREVIEREDSLTLSRLVSRELLSSRELFSLLEMANGRGNTKAAAYLLAYGKARKETEDPFWL